jgi:hypothetical protein
LRLEWEETVTNEVYVTEDIDDGGNVASDADPRSVTVYVPQDSASGTVLGAYARFGGYSETEAALGATEAAAKILYTEDFVSDCTGESISADFHKYSATLTATGDDEGGIHLAGNGNLLLKTDMNLYGQSDGDMSVRSSQKISFEGPNGVNFLSENRQGDINIKCNKYTTTASEKETVKVNYRKSMFYGREIRSFSKNETKTYDLLKFDLKFGLLNIFPTFALRLEQHQSMSISLGMAMTYSLVGLAVYPVGFGMFFKYCGYSHNAFEFEASTVCYKALLNKIGMSNVKTAMTQVEGRVSSLVVQNNTIAYERRQVSALARQINLEQAQLHVNM